MKELIKVDFADNTTRARDVYDFIYKDIEKKTSFSHWFSRAVNKYDFKEGKDFRSYLTETTNGRPKIDYVVTIDMGKELAMVSTTKQGSVVRKYFLKCEKLLQESIIKNSSILLASKQVRKSLTDAVKDSGENERMHNHGFSTYTLMVYKFLGIKKDYQDWKKSTGGKGDYRKTLPLEMRERIATAETLVKGMLELQKQHGEIKAVLEPLFKVKEIK